jgi:hypothetical protein
MRLENADWMSEIERYGTHFGHSVSTAGDVNGDGYADVIIGAPYYTHSQEHEGQALVYYGNRGNNVTIVPQHQQNDPTTIHLAMSGRTPFGRGKVKLEWEVRPSTSPFKVPTGLSECWLDTGREGLWLDEQVVGLRYDTPYHWRMRVRYHPAVMPFEQYSRWLSASAMGWTGEALHIGPLVFSESSSTATVMVALESPAPNTIIVNYATRDGTAKANSDYVAADDHLIFRRDDREKEVVVEIVDDEQDEENEFFWIDLSSDDENFEDWTARLVILDDEWSAFLPAVLHDPADPLCEQDEYYEENDDWRGLEPCDPLIRNRTYHAYPDDTEDYYYFVLSRPAHVKVVVDDYAPTSKNGQLQLWGPASGDQRGRLRCDFLIPGHRRMACESHLEPGKYYVRVYTSDEYSKKDLYTLKISY